MITFEDSRLRQELTVCYDKSTAQGLPNMAIRSLTGDEFWSRLRGNFIVASKPAWGAEDVQCDVLGPVTEYFKLLVLYKGPKLLQQPQEQYSDKKWKEIEDRASGTNRTDTRNDTPFHNSVGKD